MEIFVVGSFWFWALVATELVLLLLFTEYENGIAATVSALAFGAALQFCGDVDLLALVRTNWLYLLVLTGVYMGFAVCWGVYKWRRYVTERLQAYDDLLEQFAREHKLPRDTKILPPELRTSFKYRVDQTRDRYHETVADTPSANYHKAQIGRWMALCVFSFVLWLLKDMVVDFFSMVYRRLSTFLQLMADNLYAKHSHIKENLELPPKAEPDRPGR